MTLSKDSLEWSINFVAKHSDGDIFPKVTEISAIVDKMDEFIAEIEGKTLGDIAVAYEKMKPVHPELLVDAENFSSDHIKPMIAFAFSVR